MRVAPRLGSERLFTLGVTIATILLTPIALYQVRCNLLSNQIVSHNSTRC